MKDIRNVGGLGSKVKRQPAAPGNGEEEAARGLEGLRALPPLPTFPLQKLPVQTVSIGISWEGCTARVAL